MRLPMRAEIVEKTMLTMILAYYLAFQKYLDKGIT
jgi:hypothetical protein